MFNELQQKYREVHSRFFRLRSIKLLHDNRSLTIKLYLLRFTADVQLSSENFGKNPKKNDTTPNELTELRFSKKLLNLNQSTPFCSGLQG